MGQYYRQIIGNKVGKILSVHNCTGILPNGDRDYNGVKLMEHSWLDNYFVNAICKKMYNNPLRIAWVGDYANEVGDFDFDIPSKPSIPDYYDAWGEFVRPIPVALDPEFSIVGKFLLNHDKREYIDISDDAYLWNSMPEETSPLPWVIHPLPLLTAVGNDRGLGDFHEGNIGYEYVGTWCWDLLELSDGAPMEYEESHIGFVERRKLFDK